MKRCKQCEELLALASWLLFSEPDNAVPLMKAQLHRLYGQLHALMGRSASSLFVLLLVFNPAQCAQRVPAFPL